MWRSFVIVWHRKRKATCLQTEQLQQINSQNFSERFMSSYRTSGVMSEFYTRCRELGKGVELIMWEHCTKWEGGCAAGMYMYIEQIAEKGFHSIRKVSVPQFFLEVMQALGREARLGCAQKYSIQHEISMALICLFSGFKRSLNSR